MVLVGPSSSGKSTWASEHFVPAEIVSSDELRARVGADETDQRAGTVAFDLLERIVIERLARGLTTVIDTTGLDADRRSAWLELAGDSNIPAYAVVFDTALETCLERNAAREHPRPQTVIKKQHRALSLVRAQLADEGFEEVLGVGPVRVAAPLVAESATGSAVSELPNHTFGLILSRFDWGESPLGETLLEVARRAEDAGFRDLWLMDHFRQIPSVGRAWEDIPEPYMALSAIAGQTRSIRLGCLVSSVTHRHPAVLGNQLATLDVVSGGRAVCGLGIGWDREEHDNYGIEFPPTPVRYEMLEETIDFLRVIWGKGGKPFEGEHYRAAALAGYPRPIQDPIPILVGGSGEKRTLRLVAAKADAANVFGKPDRVAHKVKVLHQHCEELDRDADEIEVTHLVNALAAPDSSTLRELVDAVRPSGTSFEQFSGRHNAALAEDLLELFSAYDRAGADHSIVSIPGVATLGTIESFAEVIDGMR